MILSELKWHCRWISKAAEYANWSKDQSTKVGAVIVRGRRQLTAGFNGFPEGINDDEDWKWERPDKYSFVEHAERNAINQGALHGISIENSTLYLNYCPPPCDSCTRSLIQTHISRVIGPMNLFPGKGKQWQRSLEIASLMLLEAGVEVYRIPGTWHNVDDKGGPIFSDEETPNHYRLAEEQMKGNEVVATSQTGFITSTSCSWGTGKYMEIEYLGYKHGPTLDTMWHKIKIFEIECPYVLTNNSPDPWTASTPL